MVKILMSILLISSITYASPKYLECVFKGSNGDPIINQVKIDEDANVINLTSHGKTQNMIAFFSPTVISGKYIYTGYGQAEESIQIDRSTLDYIFTLQLMLDNIPFGKPSISNGKCKILNLRNQI